MGTYSTAVKGNRMQAVLDALGAGGKVKVYTAAKGTLLVTFALGNPSATRSGVVLTLSGLPITATAAATGTAAVGTLTTSADVVVRDDMTVGLSGEELNVSTLSITSGAEVDLNSATFTHG